MSHITLANRQQNMILDGKYAVTSRNCRRWREKIRSYQEITPIAPRSIEINNQDWKSAKCMLHMLSPEANKFVLGIHS